MAEDCRMPSLTELARDERGQIAIIFALILVPLISIVSLSIDYGRMLKVQSQIANAADAAGAAALHRLPSNAGDLEPFVRVQLDANLPEHLKEIPFELVVSNKRRFVQISMKTEVRTALIALVGVEKMDVNVLSRQFMPRGGLGAGNASRPGGVSPIQAREAEETIRRVARELGGGNMGTGNFSPPQAQTNKGPSKEEVKRLTEDINRRLKEVLEGSGHGQIDIGDLQSAFGG